MTHAHDVAIKIDDAGFAYFADRWVFQHCSAVVEPGSILSILGPNGSGKTTLLKLLLGLLQPVSGSVTIQGRVAFVPQLFSVAFDYSVLDMVLMGRARQIGLFSQPSRADEVIAMRMLERFGLHGYAHQAFHQLSGGQRQLVILARALVADAQLLILDEPASALDLRNQSVVLRHIHRLSKEQGITTVFTTHQANHALAISDRTLLMVEQEPAIFGTTAEVLTEANMERLYGVPLRRLRFEHAGAEHEAIVPVLDYDVSSATGLV